MLTFDGMNFVEERLQRSLSPDTNGDVGPNHYVKRSTHLSEFLTSQATHLLARSARHSIHSSLRWAEAPLWQ